MTSRDARVVSDGGRQRQDRTTARSARAQRFPQRSRDRRGGVRTREP